MKPTLVTGAAGFLGCRVVEALLARGEPVRALDVAEPVEPPSGPTEWIAASVLDAAALTRAAAGTAAVIHCAANAQLWARDAETFGRVNHGGTIAAVAAARAAGARLVLVSSFTTLVARGARPGATLDETAEHPPKALLGPYPRAKRRAEIAALTAEGLDAVVALPTAPIGAGGRALTPPMALLRDIARGALPATLDAPINVVPAKAVAAGIVAARDRGAAGRRYLLAGDDMALGAFAARVAVAAGVRPPRFTVPDSLARAAAAAEAALARATGRPPRADPTGVALALARPRFSAARARAELGWTPGDLDAAIAEALAFLRARGDV